MRLFFIIAAAAGTALLGGGASLAGDNGPWCVKADLGGAWVVDMCHFWTFEQCREERAFYGNTALCVHNPRYIAYRTERGGPKARAVKRKFER